MVAVTVAALYLAISTGLHLASNLIVLARMLRVRLLPPAPADAPGVTILRPACGLENHIEEALASTFALQHPRTELIFCVAAPDDPIVPVIRRLIEAHPGRDAKLLIGEDRISPNPKLNNLVKGWAAARYDWIIMSDSNVLLPVDYVEQLKARWTGDVGLVCSPPAGGMPDGVWAELECGFLNTYQGRWQLCADGIGMGFAQGKNMLWRRDILDQAGGLKALVAEVAEDAAATKVVRDAGFRVTLVDRPFVQPLGQRRFAEVWKRQIRWARLRRVSFKLFFLPELIAGGALPLAAAIYLTARFDLPAFLPVIFFAAWYGLEVLLARAAQWPIGWRAPFIWFLRDLMLPPLWFASVLGSDFTWRGHDMTVADDRPAPPAWRVRLRRALAAYSLGSR